MEAVLTLLGCLAVGGLGAAGIWTLNHFWPD